MKMVAQSQKSGLLARIAHRAKQVQAEVSKTPINYGNPSLPPGINNGVAQLDWIRFAEFKDGDNKGEIYFMAMGTVKTPTHHEGIKVVGLKTSIGPEAFCDTPKNESRPTFKHHYNWIVDEIAKLGDMKKEDINIENMEAIAQKLTQIRPFFTFSTWQGKKQTTGKYAGKDPKIVHKWHGRTEYTEDKQTDGMQDQGATNTNGTPPALEDKNGVVGDTGEPTQEAFNEFDNPDEVNPGVETTQEDTREMTEDEKLEDLINRASDDEDVDDEARNTIQEMVTKAGVTEQQVIDANSYRELVGMMKQKQLEESVKKEVEEKAKVTETKTTETKKAKEVKPPEVGETCKYKKNKDSKPMDCEIVKVNMTAKIVDLRDMATEKIYKGVKLESIKLD